MTEAEWFASTDPRALAEFIHGKVAAERFQDFADNLVEEVRELLTGGTWDWLDWYKAWRAGTGRHPRELITVEWCDSNRPRGGLEADKALNHLIWTEDPLLAAGFAADAAVRRAGRIHPRADPEFWESSTIQLRTKLCAEFRDIAGNPFRRVMWQPEWSSETAVALARGVEAERAFDRMPILADALEEAGCNEPQVLQHCRHESVHVRGCWVIDSVLGRALS